METAEKRYTGLYEWVEIITASLVIITFVFTFLFRLVQVDGTSMETTLHDRERLVLSCLPYTPARGDIVVVSQGGENEPLIKRVIALEGDTVSIDAQTGTVYLNGELLQEPYIHVPTAMERMEGEVTVPEGMVFIMGDNRLRGHSLDSRTFGCVETGRLIGKAVYRVSPMDRLGGLYDEF